MSGMGIGGHQSARMESDTWLTPPSILAKLGHFDLDPCASPDMPWSTADRMISLPECGLAAKWEGRVWCNPPYSSGVRDWLSKLAAHGDGVALIFARTETSWFFETIWKHASALLFIEGRLHFHHRDGTRAPNNAGAPSVLVAFGSANAFALSRCGIAGAFVQIVHGICLAAPIEPKPMPAAERDPRQLEMISC